jgi:hypothetical protein
MTSGPQLSGPRSGLTRPLAGPRHRQLAPRQRYWLRKTGNRGSALKLAHVDPAQPPGSGATQPWTTFHVQPAGARGRHQTNTVARPDPMRHASVRANARNGRLARASLVRRASPPRRPACSPMSVPITGPDLARPQHRVMFHVQRGSRGRQTAEVLRPLLSTDAPRNPCHPSHRAAADSPTRSRRRLQSPGMGRRRGTLRPLRTTYIASRTSDDRPRAGSPTTDASACSD